MNENFQKNKLNTPSKEEKTRFSSEKLHGISIVLQESAEFPQGF
jgi:hypothetical protein